MIEIPRATLEAMGEALVQVQRQQILDKKNRDGGSFPPGVDLIQSGNLIRSIRYVIEGQELYLECPVGYAEVLDKRYAWFGLNEASEAKLAALWEPLLAQGATWKEAA